MRILNYKTVTHTNKEKMSVIYEDLFETFKSIKNWFSTLSKHHSLWNFSEVRFSIFFSVFELLSIVMILIYQKLGSVERVQQTIKLGAPYCFA